MAEMLRTSDELVEVVRRTSYEIPRELVDEAIARGRIAVGSLIFRDDEKLLLIRRAPGTVMDEEDKLEGVGGNIGPYEDLIEALQHEIDTELKNPESDLVISVDQFFDLRPFEFQRADGQTWVYIVASYLCRLHQGIPASGEKKVAELKWLTLGELYGWPAEELSPWTVTMRGLYQSRYGDRLYYKMRTDG